MKCQKPGNQRPKKYTSFFNRNTNVIQKVWNKHEGWISPELNLLALTPQKDILGILAADARFDLLSNHIQTYTENRI